MLVHVILLCYELTQLRMLSDPLRPLLLEGWLLEYLQEIGPSILTMNKTSFWQGLQKAESEASPDSLLPGSH